MRTFLILAQAAAVTLLAVIGAHGDPKQPCPVTADAVAERDCGE